MRSGIIGLIAILFAGIVAQVVGTGLLTIKLLISVFMGITVSDSV